MSEQNASPEPTQPANTGNPWRTATVVVAVVGAGLTVITGLAGFGIGLATGHGHESGRGHHQMVTQFPGPDGMGPDAMGPDGPGFDGPGRHHGDDRDGAGRSN